MKEQKARILLLEDDQDLQELLVSYYRPRGYELSCYSDPTTPLAELQSASNPDQMYDVVLSDLKMPNMDGMEFIHQMKKIAPMIPIIMMTADTKVEVALKAIEAGAYDFVVKPLHFPQLNVSLERALHTKQLESANEALRTQVKSGQSFAGIVGKSNAMKIVFDLAKRVSGSPATVLIQGESGTGKEVIARAIHQLGNRRKGPFVAINCSAIPDALLESELFGYAKGAFTGAVDKKIGLFEEANGGVLFLDEIGDLNLHLQAKLLRVLQERKVKRIGENTQRPIDVRILAATHKNLMTEVSEKRFREDLFFRLNVIPIHIPPLRERPEDIFPLAEHFLNRFRSENQSSARSFSKAAIEHLMRLRWRGNVRELENSIERAVVLCEGSEIQVKDLPALEQIGPQSAAVVSENLISSIGNRTELPTLDAVILEYVDLVLNRAGGVKEQAARILKIDRKTLYRRIDDLERKRNMMKHMPPPVVTLNTHSSIPHLA